MDDQAQDISKMIFKKIDTIFIDSIKLLPAHLCTIEALYQIIMPSLSGLIHKHCETMANLLADRGAPGSQRELFHGLIQELVTGCYQSYDELNHTKH